MRSEAINKVKIKFKNRKPKITRLMSHMDIHQYWLKIMYYTKEKVIKQARIIKKDLSSVHSNLSATVSENLWHLDA